MKGFEPSISGPPDQHFNRTKLHPDAAKLKKNLGIFLDFFKNKYYF